MSQLMTSTEAGVKIGKSGRTVSRLAQAKELTYTQQLPGDNGAYLFSQADIDAWLESHPEQAAKLAEARDKVSKLSPEAAS